MTSITEIGNIALISLGEDPLETVEYTTGRNKPARVINRRYPRIRDAVLRAHPWNCAQKRESLPEVLPSPIWGPDHVYNLPSDFLRVLRTRRREATWKVEGRQVVSNHDAPMDILYIKRIDDPNEFDALLIEAIGARLAADICMTITQSNSLAQTMWELYRQKIIEARGMDGQEGTGDELIADEWLQSRRVGVSNPFGSNEAF